MKIENGQNLELFNSKFISEMRRVSCTDARAVSLKKMMLAVVDRCARLEREVQNLKDKKA